MKAFSLFLLTVWLAAAASTQSTHTRVPVLLELFTSEGCSSCPPADEFLTSLDRAQPISGAELIVISEHVDYWNRLGWIDRNSSRFFSDRQTSYAERLHSDDVYTPQLIVDGTYGLAGGDREKAERAIRSALHARKTSISIQASNKGVSAQVHVAIAGAVGRGASDVYLALALDRVSTSVTAGENSGHELTHPAVAFSVRKLGTLEDSPFKRDILASFGDEAKNARVRIIVFAQDRRTGRIVGTAQTAL
jgi:hypothetical protein